MTEKAWFIAILDPEKPAGTRQGHTFQIIMQSVSVFAIGRLLPTPHRVERNDPFGEERMNQTLLKYCVSLAVLSIASLNAPAFAADAPAQTNQNAASSR